MKALVFVSILFSYFIANAEADSGLACTMAYSSSSALAIGVDAQTSWLSENSKMSGSAVSVGKDGLWTEKSANHIVVRKDGGFWTVTILDENERKIGLFSFAETEGMKATIPQNAFRAGESEDPEKYDKLEVSCHFVIFAG